MSNKDCNDAVGRVFDYIKIDKINEFIDNIVCISDVRKNFYKRLIGVRYEKIKEVYKLMENRS